MMNCALALRIFPEAIIVVVGANKATSGAVAKPVVNKNDVINNKIFKYFDLMNKL